MRTALLAAALFSAVASAQAPAPPTLTLEDARQWEVPLQASLSRDGLWFACTLRTTDGEFRLVLRKTDGPETQSVPNAPVWSFSDDSRWIAYQQGPSQKEREQLERANKPVPSKVVLRRLEDGAEETFEEGRSFQFLKSGFLVVSVPATRELLVKPLSGGQVWSVAGVSGYSANESQTLLAAALAPGGPTQSVVILDPTRRTIRTVHWGKGRPSPVVWAKDRDTAAFLWSEDREGKEGPFNRLYVLPDARDAEPRTTVLDPEKTEGFPAGCRIVEDVPIQLNPAGDSVAFGIRPWKDKPKQPDKPEDRADVEVWHWKDVEPIPLQKRQEAFLRRRAFLGLWRIGPNKFVQATDDLLLRPVLARNHSRVLIEDPRPYRTSKVVGGFTFSDWWVLDPSSGSKKKLLEKTAWDPFLSPDGAWAAVYQDGHYSVVDLATLQRREVTKRAGVRFDDELYDGPRRQPPAESNPAWLADGRRVLFFDRYDTWAYDLRADTLERLTKGREEKIVCRPLNVYPDDELLDLGKPTYFSLQGDETKRSGFGLRTPSGEFTVLAYEDRRLSGLRRIPDGDRFLFAIQSYQESPSFYVTNGRFEAVKTVLKTNPQQERFAWGKAQLVSYKSRWGVPLQGILVYPARYQAGSTYPMVTVIYERQSDGLHSYRFPSDTDPYNVQMLSQKGYFVFLPDIAYRTGHPGLSAVDCLEPAVDAVLRLRVGVDAQRIGLAGHSWGAYQTVFVLTKSKRFRAGVAGAPLTELISMSNSFYWNSGVPNVEIFESSQGRMGVPWWEALQDYMANSPLFQIQGLQAPLMVVFGDQDGAVDWHQGQYLYNTLRRMGKPLVMIVYRGENHFPAKPANQRDFARRSFHFFDVHLKGAKPEPWVTEGQPLIPN